MCAQNAPGGAHLPEREGALGVRVCAQQVREAFCRRQIELPCRKGTSRKLARRRRAEPWEGGECPANGGLDRPAPVNVELADVLPRHSCWAREPDSHAAIERGARGCVNDRRRDEFPGSREQSIAAREHAFNNAPCGWTRDAYNSNGSSARTAAHGKDGVIR